MVFSEQRVVVNFETAGFRPRAIVVGRGVEADARAFLTKKNMFTKSKPRWITCSSIARVNYNCSGPDCVVICNLINVHTHTSPLGRFNASGIE